MSFEKFIMSLKLTLSLLPISIILSIFLTSCFILPTKLLTSPKFISKYLFSSPLKYLSILKSSEISVPSNFNHSSFLSNRALLSLNNLGNFFIIIL